ncbi:hypothetical protein HD806DRAFT_526624 [Xylariaceae sp. AK1471]|nr:hypothetical protein HD806DRAFT_526624 [Xylariaceae sp. AK1471]
MTTILFIIYVCPQPSIASLSQRDKIISPRKANFVYNKFSRPALQRSSYCLTLMPLIATELPSQQPYQKPYINNPPTLSQSMCNTIMRIHMPFKVGQCPSSVW